MSKYDQITYEVDGILGKIYLNRPKKLNAYTPDMGDQIIDAFRDANNNNNIVAIALLGHGKSFCAGADKDYLLGKKKSKSGLKIGEDEFISSFVKELALSNKILIGGIKGALPSSSAPSSPVKGPGCISLRVSISGTFKFVEKRGTSNSF